MIDSVLLVAAVLAFGYWGVHSLYRLFYGIDPDVDVLDGEVDRSIDR